MLQQRLHRPEVPLAEATPRGVSDLMVLGVQLQLVLATEGKAALAAAIFVHVTFGKSSNHRRRPGSFIILSLCRHIGGCGWFRIPGDFDNLLDGRPEANRRLLAASVQPMAALHKDQQPFKAGLVHLVNLVSMILQPLCVCKLLLKQKGSVKVRHEQQTN